MSASESMSFRCGACGTYVPNLWTVNAVVKIMKAHACPGFVPGATDEGRARPADSEVLSKAPEGHSVREPSGLRFLCRCGHVHAADADYEDAGCRECECATWEEPAYDGPRNPVVSWEVMMRERASSEAKAEKWLYGMRVFSEDEKAHYITTHPANEDAARAAIGFLRDVVSADAELILDTVCPPDNLYFTAARPEMRCPRCGSASGMWCTCAARVRTFTTSDGPQAVASDSGSGS